MVVIEYFRQEKSFLLLFCSHSPFFPRSFQLPRVGDLSEFPPLFQPPFSCLARKSSDSLGVLDSLDLFPLDLALLCFSQFFPPASAHLSPFAASHAPFYMTSYFPLSQFAPSIVSPGVSLLPCAFPFCMESCLLSFSKFS